MPDATLKQIHGYTTPEWLEYTSWPWFSAHREEWTIQMGFLTREEAEQYIRTSGYDRTHTTRHRDDF